MKTRMAAAIVLLCSSCTATPIRIANERPPPVSARSAPLEKHEVHRPVHLMGSVLPDDVLRDSATTKAAATQYVISPDPDPVKINDLTRLTAGVTQTVHVMQVSRSEGKLTPVEVRAARDSVDELRFYLADNIGE